MSLIEAVRRAEQNKDVEKLISENYFLCSVFTSLKGNEIEEWILHFYSPKKKKIVDCFVSMPDQSVTVGEETPAMKKMQKLDIDKMKITDEQALAIVKKQFTRKTTSILMTLHQKEKIIWTINMITPDMTVNSFDIDSSTGKVLDQKTTSLIKTFDINSKYEPKS